MRDALSQTFSALADPTRRAMLAQLALGEASVSELARPFLKDMSLPAVTKHLQVLEKAGLVNKTRAAQWRPCTLNAIALRDVADWMETYRQFWEESLDRLDEYLKAVMLTTSATPTPKGKSRGRKKINRTRSGSRASTTRR